jgi:type VI protein secretion system component VasF
MESLRTKRTALSAKLASYEARLVQTPQVVQEYLDMTRDRENSLARYREMKAKLMEAEVAQELEKDRKSERFSLIDPPQFPERPRSPNRPAILWVGLIAALGVGMGYGGAAEAVDPSIKSAKQLGRKFPAPILSVIPHIETAEERAKRKRKRLVLWALIAAALVLAAVLIHLFYMPLELLWYLIPRRLGISM